MDPDCRTRVGKILAQLADQIEETKHAKPGIIQTHEFWLGRQTGLEDTARLIENEFNLSRMEFMAREVDLGLSPGRFRKGEFVYT